MWKKAITCMDYWRNSNSGVRYSQRRAAVTSHSPHGRKVLWTNSGTLAPCPLCAKQCLLDPQTAKSSDVHQQNPFSGKLEDPHASAGMNLVNIVGSERNHRGGAQPVQLRKARRPALFRSSHVVGKERQGSGFHGSRRTGCSWGEVRAQGAPEALECSLTAAIVSLVFPCVIICKRNTWFMLPISV